MKTSSPESLDPNNPKITFDELKEQANLQGFDDIGTCSPAIPYDDIRAYNQWAEKKCHGSLLYMENDIRCYPEKIFPGAKTAIIFVSYYKQEKLPFKKDEGLIASYARGKKYHNVHHKRLKKFISWLERRTGQKNIARGFSDSFPIMEKALAVKAGLGWFGKSTLLIHRKFGTFTLLSGVLTTLDLPKTEKKERGLRCGSCTKCIDSCPTKALSPYQLDAKKCLSMHLIESKCEIPDSISKKNPGYIFGCDICQDVCPHNKLKPQSENPDFSPQSGMGEYITKEDLKDITENPQKLFGTALQRRGASGLKENAEKIFDNL